MLQSSFFFLKLGQYLFTRLRAVEDDEGKQRYPQPSDVEVVAVLGSSPVGKVVVDS